LSKFPIIQPIILLIVSIIVMAYGIWVYLSIKRKKIKPIFGFYFTTVGYLCLMIILIFVAILGIVSHC
jgi:hypothetical protein